jgi:hypothetical protein
MVNQEAHRPTDYELWRDALLLAWSGTKWAERPARYPYHGGADTNRPEQAAAWAEQIAAEARPFLRVLLRYQQEVPLYLTQGDTK